MRACFILILLIFTGCASITRDSSSIHIKSLGVTKYNGSLNIGYLDIKETIIDEENINDYICPEPICRVCGK